MYKCVQLTSWHIDILHPSFSHSIALPQYILLHVKLILPLLPLSQHYTPNLIPYYHHTCKASVDLHLFAPPPPLPPYHLEYHSYPTVYICLSSFSIACLISSP